MPEFVIGALRLVGMYLRCQLPCAFAQCLLSTKEGGTGFVQVL
ncbi:hypothetical protein [uncultured Microbulbifer sp.]|nr:hypothetical protein [uncultured Microbulbifer sp.]